MTTLPEETMLGALVNAVVRYKGELKPMYANFGLLPPVMIRGPRFERRKKMSYRALKAMEGFLRKEGEVWQTCRCKSVQTN